jgi:hypothetical protein
VVHRDDASRTGRSTGARRTRVVDIVSSLASSGPLPEGRELSVMNEPEPLYAGTETFPESLARLATGRRERFASMLDATVAD